MDLKVFVLCCLSQFAFGQFIPESKATESCRDFVSPVSYPLARRNDSIIETHHGVTLADPYRWLEYRHSNETKQFINDQNKLSESYLNNCDTWRKINDKLNEMNDFEKYTLPQYHDEYYYYQMNTGLQHQSVYYRKKSLDDEPSVFLDPNEMSTDGTISITSFVFSGDEEMVAYTFSKFNSDWNKLKIRNVETGEDYPETLEGLKFSHTSWTSDSRGFFYNRYLKYGDGTETYKLEHQKVYYHRVGEFQNEDVLVFEFPELPLSSSAVTVTEKYLILQLHPSGLVTDNHLYYADLEKHGEIYGKIPLEPIYTADPNNEFNLVSIIGSKAIYHTTRNAPNYILVEIDLENPAEENWTTLIQEHPHDILLKAFPVGEDKILTVYLHDVKSILQLHSLKTGQVIRRIPLGMETLGDLSFDKTQTEMFVQLSSFVSPGAVYRYNLTDPNANLTPFYEMKPNMNGFDKENYDIEQVFYPSRDGTSIPMFLVQKKTSANEAGPKPTLLYGYGAFIVTSLSLPIFFLDWFFFVNNFEGILAVANIRGGGEYGKRWHDAGKLFNKQDSFDDFHAAAEYLIDSQYTTKDKLAIRGTSNGGLLVGACINQRPDLYAAAIPECGPHDMIRYPLFTFAGATTRELGDPQKRIEFENILKFSPLHNIHTPKSTQTQYPATLIMTADHDDRVAPLHSFKFTAALQHAVQGNAYQKNPILIKLLKGGGHDETGKPQYQLINLATDILTFLYRALSVKIDP